MERDRNELPGSPLERDDDEEARHAAFEAGREVANEEERLRQDDTPDAHDMTESLEHRGAPSESDLERIEDEVLTELARETDPRAIEGPGEISSVIIEVLEAIEARKRAEPEPAPELGTEAAGETPPLTRDPERALLLAQGSFYLASGLWPIVNERSFASVTGFALERRLARTTGGLIAAVGASLVAAGLSGRGRREGAILGATCAGALGLATSWYALRGRISRVHLLDALLELAFVAGHVAFGRRGAGAVEATSDGSEMMMKDEGEPALAT